MDIAKLLHEIEVRGCTLTVRPIDPLNPRCGYTATLEGFGGTVVRDAGTPAGALALLLADEAGVARVAA